MSTKKSPKQKLKLSIFYFIRIIFKTACTAHWEIFSSVLNHLSNFQRKLFLNSVHWNERSQQNKQNYDWEQVHRISVMNQKKNCGEYCWKIRWLPKIKLATPRMIQSKCADLLFLIGVVCGVVSCSVNYFGRNNKPFLVDRDDIIGSHERQSNDDRFMFTTMRC